jgi:cystathionine beta-lyase
MRYDFNALIDRKETSCLKWSYLEQIYGTEDLTSMWVADSDFKVPQPVIDRIVRRAEHGIFGYTAKPMAFYEAFMAWQQKRHGLDIKKEWMCTVPGIVPAINWGIQTYTKPGDKIIVQTPVYYPFFTSVTNNGRG